MENERMEVFNNTEFGSIRIIQEGEKSLFCAKDVAVALGYKDTINAIKAHCKGVVKRHLLSEGGNQLTNFIPEGDVYRLITHSKLPAAEKFERWVFDEVLPSIRKHGAYVTDEILAQMEEHPELITEFFQRLQDENARAKAAREALEKAQAENALLAPKAGYYDHFVSNEDLTCLRYTAKELGVPQNKFIGYLLEKNYVFRDRHRDGRVFAKASKRNDPLFMTRDFYLPDATKSEYTLVTPAGKAHFHARVDEIRTWEPGLAAGEVITEQAVFADDPVKPEEPR